MKKISTDPYKGTRDFYPGDMEIQKYMFRIMREVVERYGYREYTASVLEETDLYRAKTGEEIVSQQTYSFTDRGGRDVTLRPEMTPTVARMIAQKGRDIALPVRWYSIPNCFRYERPQKGRLREFWQLNVDLFGLTGACADAELIEMASALMLAFGASPERFTIRVNSRKLMTELFEGLLGLDQESSYQVAKLIDRKDKITPEEFENEVSQYVRDIEVFKGFLFSDTVDNLPQSLIKSSAVTEIREVLELLSRAGVTNVVFDPSLMRGFDYYTGVVFEVYDTGTENNRSLFGGGRYDDLLDIFDKEKIPAVGFGAGDVSIEDYLRTYGLLPDASAGNGVMVCSVAEEDILEALSVVQRIREVGIVAGLDPSARKLGQKIKAAEQNGFQYAIAIGARERESGVFVLKNLKDETEESCILDKLLARLQ